MQHPPAGLPRDSVALPANEHQGLADEAERALADRPYISISLRIGLSMLLCFLLIAGVVMASLRLISTVSVSQEFLEKVSMYALEVEHARRFEKNYLLYGTNLDDALTQIQAAHQLLRSMKESMVELVGLGAFERIERSLEQYGIMIERLAAFDRKEDEARGEGRSDVERELRRNGAQMLADATDMMDRERLRLHTAVRTSSWIAASSLLFILVVMVFVTYILTRQIAKPLRRFVEYTERIAGGDFSPIQPARRYRDEFSHLAIAINRMSLQLKDREAQLDRTSRMAAVGTLTAGIAHELNNPLTNIGLNAEALHDGLTSYTESQKLKMLSDILTQVERAGATVRNLLDFTRVEKPVFVSVSPADVVREVRNLLSNEAELSNVRFDVDVPESLPRIEGSPRDLQQVFLNLLLNAIQAMPDGGTISVRARATDEGTIQIEFADTGVGIPEEQVGSIFDPFFTTKEVGQGTGLGLFVTYGIVERHRGSIAVKSEVGAGSTFTVTLPISPQATKETANDRQEN